MGTGPPDVGLLGPLSPTETGAPRSPHAASKHRWGCAAGVKDGITGCQWRVGNWPPEGPFVCFGGFWCFFVGFYVVVFFFWGGGIFTHFHSIPFHSVAARYPPALCTLATTGPGHRGRQPWGRAHAPATGGDPEGNEDWGADVGAREKAERALGAVVAAVPGPQVRA